MASSRILSQAPLPVDGGMRIIDIHRHPLPEWYLANLARIGVAQLGGQSLADPALRWTPEIMLAQMDEHAIAASMLSFAGPGVAIGDEGFRREHIRQSNEYLASLVAEMNGRVRGLAVLPLPAIGDALAELRYAIDELRLDGVAILTNYDDLYLGDRHFEPLLAELSRRRLPLFIHPTKPDYDAPLSYQPWILEFAVNTTRAVMHLIYSGTLDRYPGIPIILAHGGGAIPFLSSRLDIGQRNSRIELAHPVRHYLSHFYYETAFTAAPEPLAALLALVEPTQLLFGSDLPWAGMAAAELCLAGVSGSPLLGPSEREAVLHGSARLLFPKFGPPEKAS